jgi:hypothetical protein
LRRARAVQKLGGVVAQRFPSGAESRRSASRTSRYSVLHRLHMTDASGRCISEHEAWSQIPSKSVALKRR